MQMDLAGLEDTYTCCQHFAKLSLMINVLKSFAEKVSNCSTGSSIFLEKISGATINLIM